MRAEGFIRLIHSPEETDHRTGEALARQCLDHPVLRKQILINIGQIRIGKHHIRIQARAICKQNASGVRRICINPFHGRVKDEFHASLAGKIHEGLDDAIHAAFGIPDAMRQFRVRHHRKSGRRFKRAQPHVNILKRKGAFQARLIKVGGHVAIMVDERLEAKEQRQILEAEEIGGLAEIAVDQFVQDELVVPFTFLQVTQKTLETSRLDGFQLLLHGFHIGSERKLAAVIKDQMIGWVDALQVEPFAHGCSQGAKFRFIQQRHYKKSGPGVKMMTLAAEAVTAPAGVRVLFQDRDVQPALWQDGLRR